MASVPFAGAMRECAPYVRARLASLSSWAEIALICKAGCGCVQTSLQRER